MNGSIKIKIDMDLMQIKNASDLFMSTDNEKYLEKQSFLFAKFSGYIDALFDVDAIDFDEWKKYLLMTYKI